MFHLVSFLVFFLLSVTFSPSHIWLILFNPLEPMSANFALLVKLKFDAVYQIFKMI